MVWQTCFCARMRRSAFSIPLPGCRAAVPFGQSPKRHQKRFCSPAPSENTCGIFRRRRISGRGSLVLLMQAGYGRWLFTLILVAVCTCWLEQGITAKVEPRRRNCRRAISLAATEKGEKATFASFCLLTKGRGCRETEKSCRQWFGRHVFARVCGAVFSASHYPDAAPQCLLAKAPKGTKNAFVPRRQAKTPAVFFDGAELAGGVVWFSSCRRGTEGGFLR